jgi:ABC-type Na+ transport system ATPase subunit NatA
VASDVREAGGAVVFASQNLEEVEHFADRVVVLLDGALVFDGSLAEFGRAPQADVFA